MGRRFRFAGLYALLTRELCQSVCSSATCLIPRPSRIYASICRASSPAQIVLPTDRETGRPRGFAFVDYADREVAEEAIRRFNQQPFKGRPLAVSTAPGRSAGRASAWWFQRPASRRSAFGVQQSPARRLLAATGRGRRRGRRTQPELRPGCATKEQAQAEPKGLRPRSERPNRPVGRLYDADEDWRAKDEVEDVEVDNFATSAKKDDVDDDNFATSAKKDDVEDDES